MSRFAASGPVRPQDGSRRQPWLTACAWLTVWPWLVVPVVLSAMLFLSGCDREAREMARWQAEHDRIAEAMAIPAESEPDADADTDAGGSGAAAPPPEPPAPEPAPGSAPGSEPEPLPDALPEAAAEEDEPAWLALQRRDCARRNGVLSRRGEGIYACVLNTRDAGQRCTASRQCEGECLARSGTCAPFTPLFGCHEVLLGPDARVTQCVD